MSRESSAFLIFLGTAAGVVSAVVAIMQLQQAAQQDANTPQDTDTGGWYGDEDYETEAVDTSGWVQVQTYQVSLPNTWEDGECLELQFDLDDAGASESTVHGEYADWADLTWSSCGGGYWGYAYGFTSSSTTVVAGGSQDAARCADGIGTGTYLELPANPSDPTTDEGCLYTTDGHIASVTVDSLSWNGATAEGRLNITLWSQA
jgi:hypothetical protein